MSATAQYEVAHHVVGDFAGTDLYATWTEFGDDWPVVQAHDPVTGLVCALAQAPGQVIENTEREAQAQLAMYIRRHR